MDKVTRALIRLSLGLAVLGALIPAGQPAALASAPVGTIAYVRPNAASGDEIRLIEPDGSGDRLLFSTGVPTTPETTDIQQLAWSPDAAELAFTSSHEFGCSLYHSDVYAIRPDGAGYRRVSGPPACGGRSRLPTGTVRVPLENHTIESGPFTVCLEGAPAPLEIALAPRAFTTVTFEGVADYGECEQAAVVIYGEVRSFYPGAEVDVRPGKTVETGLLEITTGFEHYGFQWPSYLPDGSAIASILHKGELYRVAASNRVPGLAGEKLDFAMPMSADFMAWGPTPALAGQFLYEGWVDGDTIFLGDVKGAEGQVLMAIDPTRIGRTLLGLAWLPDGSGFLYSVSEMVDWADKADIWEYSFATKESRHVTNVSRGFIRRMAVSPDGEKIVYEHEMAETWYSENPATDLWLVSRDGSAAALLVENGRAPAWSPQAIPDLAAMDETPVTPEPMPVVPGQAPAAPAPEPAVPVHKSFLQRILEFLACLFRRDCQ